MNDTSTVAVCAITPPKSQTGLGVSETGSEAVLEAPKGADLDTYGDNYSDRAREAARERYRDRSLLWLESSSKAVRACGRCRRKGVDRVEIRVSEKGLGLSGLQHCGSVWICPVCAATVWSERSLEIGTAAALHLGTGGTLAMATFTTRHHAGDGLDDLVKWLRAGWKAVWQGEHGMKLREALDLFGYVRVMEINYGENGWHPHFHVALFLRPGADFAEVERVLGSAFDRWASGVVAAGGKVPTRQAQDVRMFDRQDGDRLAEYLTKQFLGPVPGAAGGGHASTAAGRLGVAVPAAPAGVAESLGREMTQGSRKAARAFYGTTPVWGLLRNVRVDGCADSLGLWWEYERATHKVRGIQWSQGLRKALGMDAERDDQEIVNDDRGGEALFVLTVGGLARLIGWSELIPGLRFAWQDGGYAGLRNFLDINGIGYEVISEREND